MQRRIALRHEAQARFAIDRINQAARNLVGGLRRRLDRHRVTDHHLDASVAELQAALRARALESYIQIALNIAIVALNRIAKARKHSADDLQDALLRQSIVTIGR